jgi:DNA-binding CsgD family transcriptional regulator
MIHVPGYVKSGMAPWQVMVGALGVPCLSRAEKSALDLSAGLRKAQAKNAARHASNRAAILNQIRRAGKIGITNRQFVERTGFTRETVRKHMEALVANRSDIGRIKRNGIWHWVLDPARAGRNN